MKRFRQFPALAGLALCALISGCTVGRSTSVPQFPCPQNGTSPKPWRESAPKDDLAKGEWWSIFHDDDLNVMEKQALDANQTIKIAAARLEQARASAAVQISTQFPFLSTSPSAQRQRFPETGPPIATSQ